MKKDYPLFIIEFLDYLETIKGRSANTAKEYGYDIYNLTKYLYSVKNRKKETVIGDKNNEVGISDLNLDFYKNVKLSDLHSYMAYLDRIHANQSATRARKTASIRTFFNYLINIRELEIKNVAESLESPKKKQRHPIYLTLNEAKKLLDTVLDEKREWIRKRDYCMLVLFLNCGMRLSELSSINIDKIKSDTLTVVGKGNKERTIYLNDACKESIKDYLQIRPIVKDEPSLFISQKHNRLSNRAIQYRIKHYIKKAGFDENLYSVHKLRHTAATLMYKYGDADMKILQEILGHTSVATTQIYTHIDNENLRDTIKKNPLNNK